jgi:hypothetical protein
MPGRYFAAAIASRFPPKTLRRPLFLFIPRLSKNRGPISVNELTSYFPKQGNAAKIAGLAALRAGMRARKI